VWQSGPSGSSVAVSHGTVGPIPCIVGTSGRTMRKRGTPIVRPGSRHRCPDPIREPRRVAASKLELTFTLVPPRTIEGRSLLLPPSPYSAPSGEGCACGQRPSTNVITPSKFGVDMAVAPKWRLKSDHVSLQNLQQMQLLNVYVLCSDPTKRAQNRHYLRTCIEAGD
jgi:hypothetical protein